MDWIILFLTIENKIIIPDNSCRRDLYLLY